MTTRTDPQPTTRLSPDAAHTLTFQDYPPAADITGVWLHILKKQRSDNGFFMEYARFTGGNVENLPAPFEVRQLSVSRAEAGRVNAFHIHPNEPQNELWTVLDGQLKVWLIDLRAGSPTEGNRRAVILSGEEPVQLHIPAGVAHGYRAGPSGAVLLYSMDQQFNLERPNEGRLPWDFFGPELWAEDRG